MRHYTKPTLRRGGRRRSPCPVLPDEFIRPIPELRPRAGARVGRVLVEAYGEEHVAELRQPGLVNGREPRSDHVSIEVEVDGEHRWVSVSLPEAARLVARRINRRLTLAELRELTS